MENWRGGGRLALLTHHLSEYENNCRTTDYGQTYNWRRTTARTRPEGAPRRHTTPARNVTPRKRSSRHLR
eukprot:4912710-Lingulodinium_polyedra.AAC.1